MHTTIANLLNIPPFDEAVFLTHRVGENKLIESITIMDVDYIEKWMKPHELLVAGDFFKNTINKDFIERIAAQECPGIITKKKFVPFIKEETITAADQAHLPILLLPDQYSWSDIMFPVSNALLENKVETIKNLNLYNRTIINSVLKDDGIDGMCEHVSQSLEQKPPLALVDKSQTLIDASKNYDWQNALLQLSQASLKPYLIPTNAQTSSLLWGKILRLVDGREMVIYPLHSDYINSLLVIFDRQTDKEELLLQLETFVQIIQLKTRLYQAAFRSTKKTNRFVLNKLMNIDEKNKANNKIKIEVMLGRILESRYRLALFEFDDPNVLKDYYEIRYRSSLTNSFEKTDYYNKIILFEEADYLVFLLGGSIQDVDSVVDDLVVRISDFFKKAPFHAGISKCNPLDQLPTSLSQAITAFNFARDHGKTYSHYSSIGFIKLLADADGDYKNPYYYELMNFYIKPILDYDEANNRDLFPTLEAFIQHRFSYKDTAEALYIHVNTLRARLDRIMTILHVESRSYDDMLNLQIAVKIYQMGRISKK